MKLIKIMYINEFNEQWAIYTLIYMKFIKKQNGS